MPKEKTGERYVRVIVVLSFLMIFTGLGFVSSTRSPFVVPVTEELGIERSLYAFVDSIRFLATAIVSLFFGPLVVRFGARRLIAVGFYSLCAAMLIAHLSHHILLFYLSGALLGIGFSFCATTMVGYVVSCWCPEKRGTVMGAVLFTLLVLTAMRRRAQ